MNSQSPSRREMLSGIAALLGVGVINPLDTLESYAYAGKNETKQSVKRELTPFQKKQREMKDANYRDFGKDSDEVLLAKMLFGEARSCSDLERVAIAYTAINRSRDNVSWNGKTTREAILTPFQYECFNLGNENRNKLKDPSKHEAKAYEECIKVARDVLSGKYQDPTNGATTYYQPDSIKEPERFKKMHKLGRINTPQGPSKHLFYKEK